MTGTTQEKPIENRVIPGITLKSLIGAVAILLGGYGSGIAFIGSMKDDINSIRNDVNDMKTEKKGDSKYLDLQYKTLEQKVDANGIQIKDLEAKYQIMLENQIKSRP